MLTVLIFVGITAIIGTALYFLIRPKAIDLFESWKTDHEKITKLKLVEYQHQEEREIAAELVLKQFDKLADRDRKIA